MTGWMWWLVEKYSQSISKQPDIQLKDLSNQWNMEIYYWQIIYEISVDDRIWL